ncbi:hypothetical protein SH2C18_08450 [Clostridium sediminicola]|uniref:hypothetical protein n=1 Tax=Clostridium sediminicola TaxID=3114879 RepID=UPI0031F259CA
MNQNNKTYNFKTSEGVNYIIYLNYHYLFISKLGADSEIKQLIKEDKIINFSVDIDLYDNFHIIYYSASKMLKYFTYSLDKGMNCIFKRKHSINSLYIKIIKENVHIFYKTENLYKFNAILYYSNFVNNTCVYQEVFETNSSNCTHSYFTDYYEKNMYLFYCEDYLHGKYILNNYYQDNNKLIKSNETIILPETQHLNFFVAPNNIGVIIYNKKIHDTWHLSINYRNLNKIESQWSSSIFTSLNNTNNNFKDNNNILSSKIVQLENKIYNLDEIVLSLKKESKRNRKLLFQKTQEYKSSLLTYDNKISNIKKVKDEYITLANKKIDVLLKDINEKDKIIFDFHKLLKKR